MTMLSVQNIPPPRERMIYMDMAKFFAILCVCIGHSYLLVSQGRSCLLNRVISSFHMPLFMLLCGYFSVRSMSMPATAFLLKKSRQLLLPALAFTCMSCVVYRLFLPTDEWSRVCISEAIGGMWFLRTLFFCYVIVYATKRTRLPDPVCCAASCLCLFLVPRGSYLQTNFMLLFFWTGYFLYQYREHVFRHRVVLTTGCAMLYCLFGHIDSNVAITPQMLMGQPSILPMQYFTGLTASMTAIGISYGVTALARIGASNIFATIGRHTLGIYGVQTILLERLAISLFRIHVPEGQANIYAYIVIPAIGLTCCIVSFLIVRISCRNNIVNQLFYGGSYK